MAPVPRRKALADRQAEQGVEDSLRGHDVTDRQGDLDPVNEICPQNLAPAGESLAFKRSRVVAGQVPKGFAMILWRTEVF